MYTTIQPSASPYTRATTVPINTPHNGSMSGDAKVHSSLAIGGRYQSAGSGEQPAVGIAQQNLFASGVFHDIPKVVSRNASMAHMETGHSTSSLKPIRGSGAQHPSHRSVSTTMGPTGASSIISPPIPTAFAGSGAEVPPAASVSSVAAALLAASKALSGIPSLPPSATTRPTVAVPYATLGAGGSQGDTAPTGSLYTTATNNSSVGFRREGSAGTLYPSSSVLAMGAGIAASPAPRGSSVALIPSADSGAKPIPAGVFGVRPTRIVPVTSSGEQSNNDASAVLAAVNATVMISQHQLPWDSAEPAPMEARSASRVLGSGATAKAVERAVAQFIMTSDERQGVARGSVPTLAAQMDAAESRPSKSLPDVSAANIPLSPVPPRADIDTSRVESVAMGVPSLDYEAPQHDGESRSTIIPSHNNINHNPTVNPMPRHGSASGHMVAGSSRTSSVGGGSTVEAVLAANAQLLARIASRSGGAAASTSNALPMAGIPPAASNGAALPVRSSSSASSLPPLSGGAGRPTASTVSPIAPSRIIVPTEEDPTSPITNGDGFDDDDVQQLPHHVSQHASYQFLPPPSLPESNGIGLVERLRLSQARDSISAIRRERQLQEEHEARNKIAAAQHLVISREQSPPQDGEVEVLITEEGERVGGGENVSHHRGYALQLGGHQGDADYRSPQQDRGRSLQGGPNAYPQEGDDSYYGVEVSVSPPSMSPARSPQVTGGADLPNSPPHAYHAAGAGGASSAAVHSTSPSKALEYPPCTQHEEEQQRGTGDAKEAKEVVVDVVNTPPVAQRPPLSPRRSEAPSATGVDAPEGGHYYPTSACSPNVPFSPSGFIDLEEVEGIAAEDSQREVGAAVHHQNGLPNADGEGTVSHRSPSQHRSEPSVATARGESTAYWNAHALHIQHSLHRTDDGRIGSAFGTIAAGDGADHPTDSSPQGEEEGDAAMSVGGDEARALHEGGLMSPPADETRHPSRAGSAEAEGRVSSLTVGHVNYQRHDADSPIARAVHEVLFGLGPINEGPMDGAPSDAIPLPSHGSSHDYDGNAVAGDTAAALGGDCDDDYVAFQQKAAALREAMAQQAMVVERNDFRAETAGRLAIEERQREAFAALILMEHEEPWDRFFIMDAYFEFLEVPLSMLLAQAHVLSSSASCSSLSTTPLAVTLRQMPLPHAVAHLHHHAREQYEASRVLVEALAEEEAMMRRDLVDFYDFDTFLAADSLFAVHCEILGGLTASHVVGGEEAAARQALSSELLGSLIMLQIGVLEALEMITREFIVGGDEGDDVADGAHGLSSPADSRRSGVSGDGDGRVTVASAYSAARSLGAAFPLLAAVGSAVAQERSIQQQLWDQKQQRDEAKVAHHHMQHREGHGNTASGSALRDGGLSSRSFLFSSAQTKGDEARWGSMQQEVEVSRFDGALGVNATLHAMGGRGDNELCSSGAIQQRQSLLASPLPQPDPSNEWSGRYYDDAEVAGGNHKAEGGAPRHCAYPFRLPLVITVRCPPDVLAGMGAQCKPNAGIDTMPSGDDKAIAEALRRVEAMITADISDTVHGGTRVRQAGGGRKKGPAKGLGITSFSIGGEEDDENGTDDGDGDVSLSNPYGRIANATYLHHTSAQGHNGTRPFTTVFSAVNVSFTSPFLTHRRAHQRELERQLVHQYQQRAIASIHSHYDGGADSHHYAPSNNARPSAATIAFLRSTPSSSYYYQQCPIAVFSYRQFVVTIVPMLMAMWWGDEDMGARDVLYEAVRGGGSAPLVLVGREGSPSTLGRGEVAPLSQSQMHARAATAGVGSRRNSPSPTRPRNPASDGPMPPPISASAAASSPSHAHSASQQHNHHHTHGEEHQQHTGQHHAVPEDQVDYRSDSNNMPRSALTALASANVGFSAAQQAIVGNTATCSRVGALELDPSMITSSPAEAIREPGRRWGDAAGNGDGFMTPAEMEALANQRSASQLYAAGRSVERERGAPAASLPLPSRDGDSFHLPSARSDGHTLHRQLLLESVERDERRRFVGGIPAQTTPASYHIDPSTMYGTTYMPQQQVQQQQQQQAGGGGGSGAHLAPSQHRGGAYPHHLERATFARPDDGGASTAAVGTPTSDRSSCVVAGASPSSPTPAAAPAGYSLPPPSATSLIPQKAVGLAIDGLFAQCDAAGSGRLRLSTVITATRQLATMMEGYQREGERLRKEQQQREKEKGPQQGPSSSSYTATLMGQGAPSPATPASTASVGAIANELFVLRHKMDYLKVIMDKLQISPSLSQQQDGRMGLSASSVTSSPLIPSSSSGSFSSWPAAATLLRKAFQLAREEEVAMLTTRRGPSASASSTVQPRDDGMIGKESFRFMIEGIVKGHITV